VELLAERSEGNLLAARQEIDKLALLLPAGARGELADVFAGSADSARFGGFPLRAAGGPPRQGRGARGPRSPGAWGGGAGAGVVGPAAGVRTGRLRRLRRAARADRMAKGLALGDPWDEIAVLTAELSGAAALPLVRAALA